MTFSIVVTGASGFVGRNLVRHLAHQGIPTVALVRQPGAMFSSPHLQTRIVSAYSDFNPTADSVLIHLAEPPHITSVDAKGDAHIEQMCEQAKALLARNYRRVIYASSATVYGDSSDLAWTPDQPLASSPKVYAQSKLMVEKLFLQSNGAVARVTNLYGPGMSSANIFADILAQLGRSAPVTIREITPVRDYLWIDDAAGAFVALALGTQSEIYNFASGSAISCGDLARLILDLAGESNREVLAHHPPRHSVLRIDIEKTKKDLQWSPAINLKTGIKMLLNPENA